MIDPKRCDRWQQAYTGFSDFDDFVWHLIGISLMPACFSPDANQSLCDKPLHSRWISDAAADSARALHALSCSVYAAPPCRQHDQVLTSRHAKAQTQRNIPGLCISDLLHNIWRKTHICLSGSLCYDVCMPLELGCQWYSYPSNVIYR